MPMTSSSNVTDGSFAVISVSTAIAGKIDEVWPIIGAFQGAERFLGGPGASGGATGVEASLGSIRMIGTEIVEVMVGKSRHSYTYAQTHGPMARHTYHGCVALECAGPRGCELIYTLTFDQSSMDGIGRRMHIDQLSARFNGMVEAMKAAAEGRA